MVDDRLPSKSNRKEVTEFLKKVSTAPRIQPATNRGRLIFAMDATASREPSWRQACHIQGQMFDVTHVLGGLDIQLCYYQGFNTFEVSHWCSDAESLRQQMTAVRCLTGHTQIQKILQHTLHETKRKKINAVVFVGDCMEEDETLLFHLAGKIGLLNVPIFVFHEGDEPGASRAFRKIAKLTGGAYCYFNIGSADLLRTLLQAVAIYAVGGRAALEDYSKSKGDKLMQLTNQLK